MDYTRSNIRKLIKQIFKGIFSKLKYSVYLFKERNDAYFKLFQEQIEISNLQDVSQKVATFSSTIQREAVTYLVMEAYGSL